MNVDGVVSNWRNVLSGIPQGTVLGPILFVIFINDVPEELKYNMCKLFADDCKLYGPVSTNENKLQLDLNNLENWSKRWQLPFNASKCKVMHFGHHNPTHSYHLNEHILEKTDHEKDLGVIIDNNLKFHAHTAAATKKANQFLGVIKKSYSTRDPRTITTLYKTMVRPHLEYGNVIWGRYYQADIKSLDSIQRRATRLITTLKDISYKERLKELQLHSLVYRRRRGDMIQMFKIMNGLVRMNINTLFSPTKILHTRGHSQRVFKKHAVKSPRANFFAQRVINDWNSIPADIPNAPSLNTFKNRLDKFWQDIYDTAD